MGEEAGRSGACLTANPVRRAILSARVDGRWNFPEKGKRASRDTGNVRCPDAEIPAKDCSAPKRREQYRTDWSYLLRPSLATIARYRSMSFFCR